MENLEPSSRPSTIRPPKWKREVELFEVRLGDGGVGLDLFFGFGAEDLVEIVRGNAGAWAFDGEVVLGEGCAWGDVLGGGD